MSAGIDRQQACGCAAPRWMQAEEQRCAEEDCKPGRDAHCEDESSGKGKGCEGKKDPSLLSLLSEWALQQAQETRSETDEEFSEAAQEKAEPSAGQIQDMRERLGLPPLPASLQLLIDGKAESIKCDPKPAVWWKTPSEDN